MASSLHWSPSSLRKYWYEYATRQRIEPLKLNTPEGGEGRGGGAPHARAHVPTRLTKAKQAREPRAAVLPALAPKVRLPKPSLATESLSTLRQCGLDPQQLNQMAPKQYNN